jgi:hypothetical protein
MRSSGVRPYAQQPVHPQGLLTVRSANFLVRMEVHQFEQIGGAKGRLPFQDGTLTVSSKGIATFA